jgi:hypothetical protein
MPNLRHVRVMPRTLRRRTEHLRRLLNDGIGLFPRWPPEMTPAVAERVRLRYYNALADLASCYGFRRDQVGVDIAPLSLRSSESEAPVFLGRLELSMSMPPELHSILQERGFL